MKNLVLSGPHFYIIGAQRSGTTLLRLLLNNHPKIAIPEETTFLMPYLGKKLYSANTISDSEVEFWIKYLSQNAQFRKWGLPIEKMDPIRELTLKPKDLVSYHYFAYAKYMNKKIVGDKTPPFIRKLPSLLAAFPNSKIIHIVRDGRDIYLSLRKLKHHSAKNLSVAALEWRIKLEIINQAKQKYPNRFIEVRYEDLISDPDIVLKKICLFLEVEFDSKMMDFWKGSQKFIGSHHSELIFKPIKNDNQGKWRNKMVRNENLEYQLIARKYLNYYGYFIDQENHSSKFMIIAKIITFLPVRIFRIVLNALQMLYASKFGKAVSEKFYE